MGTTGSSDSGTMNSALPDLISRVRDYTDLPLAVGFGVATRAHFDLVADAGADGVVIGSRIISVIKSAAQVQVAQKVEEYCREISLKGQPPKRPSASHRPSSTRSRPSVKHTVSTDSAHQNILPPRFGQFGGQYVPEALWDCLVELEEAHNTAMKDPEFQKEWKNLYGYMNRPSNLYKAEKLTEHAGGATIWLKREDLYVAAIGFASPCADDVVRNHTGSHKINNAIGQVRERLTMQVPELTLVLSPDPPSEEVRQDPYHRRDWCRPTRCRHCHGLCTVWPPVCHLHGCRGRKASSTQRLPYPHARCRGHSCTFRVVYAEGCRERGSPRLGD